MESAQQPSFYKSISLFIVFVLLTPVTLAVSVFSLYFIATSTTTKKAALEENSNAKLEYIGANIFAALPDTIPSIESAVGAEDARAQIIKSYLKRYNSPLLPHAEYIVEVADEVEIDFRLITAIAQQESNLCKFIPEGSYNCWGWGIHSRGTLGFSSYEEGIRTVSAGLKREYINKGFKTPEEIMKKYTPLSNGSWAYGVGSFLEDME